MTEDKMVKWPHQLNGHEFEQTSRDSEGQGSLECYVRNISSILIFFYNIV